MVTAAMPIGELRRLAPEGEADQLMPEADTERRQSCPGELANVLDGVVAPPRDRPGRWRGRAHRASAPAPAPRWSSAGTTVTRQPVCHQHSDDVALHAVVVGDDVRTFTLGPGLPRPSLARPGRARHRRATPGAGGELRGWLPPSAMTPRIAPRSRRCRVSRRVSTPSMHRDAGRREPVVEAARGAPVGGLAGQLAHHDAAHLRALRLHVLGVDPVVPDHRRGHHDDLAEVARDR